MQCLHVKASELRQNDRIAEQTIGEVVHVLNGKSYKIRVAFTDNTERVLKPSEVVQILRPARGGARHRPQSGNQARKPHAYELEGLNVPPQTQEQMLQILDILEEGPKTARAVARRLWPRHQAWRTVEASRALSRCAAYRLLRLRRLGLLMSSNTDPMVWRIKPGFVRPDLSSLR